MNVAVPVPMWVIYAITDTHIRNVEDDVQWSLMIGATPSGYDVERYGNAMAELRRIFVRKAFNR